MNSSSRAVRCKVSAQLTSVSFLALTPYSADTGTEMTGGDGGGDRQTDMGRRQKETDRHEGGDRKGQKHRKSRPIMLFLFL